MVLLLKWQSLEDQMGYDYLQDKTRCNSKGATVQYSHKKDTINTTCTSTMVLSNLTIFNGYHWEPKFQAKTNKVLTTCGSKLINQVEL